MGLGRSFRGALALLALGGMLFPRYAFGNEHGNSVVDVRMQQGRVIGYVVDSNGKPASSTVVARQNGSVVSESKSDTEGRFVLGNLRGGSYFIGTKDTGKLCRVWTEVAAPPAAVDSLLLTDGPVVRGRYAPGCYPSSGGLFGGSLVNFVSNPWVIAGVVGSAIAIPLAVDDDDAS